MANYYCASRTNYFRVTDEEKYAALFKRLYAYDDEVQDFTKTAEDGKTLFHGFGGYGHIAFKGCFFDPHNADSEWNDRAGEPVEVIRQLTGEEADIDHVGPMYRIRFEDGTETDAFEDELEYSPYDDSDNMDDFFELLSEILPDGEAVMLFEVGNEKLRYLTGYAYVATNKEVRFISLEDAAIDAAREMLADPSFTTKCYY